MTATVEDVATRQESRRPGGARRLVVLVVAGVLVLVIGLAGGLFLGRYQLWSTDQTATPGPADIGFSQDMTVHHQQAITMSQLVEDKSGPAVRALARQIERGQLQQIGQLQGWLAVWGAPQLSDHPMAWMHGQQGSGGMPGMDMGAGHDAADDQTMPGLANQDELGQLQTLTGRDLDVLFLQLMIRHHQGGLGMTQQAAQQAQTAPVKALAANMAVDESQEIAYMNVLLSQLGGKPLPTS